MAVPAVTYGRLALEDIVTSRWRHGRVVETSERKWVVRAQPHVRIRLKNVFGGAAKNQREAVHLSNTDDVCRDLAWFLERYPLEMSKKDRAALRRARNRQIKRVESVEQILRGEFELPSVEMAMPARPYQEQAAAALLENGFLLLVDELGLGKTVSAIRAIADTRTLPALCVVQAPLTRQWSDDEIAKFLPDLRVHVVKTSSPYDLRDDENQEPHVVVISYAKLSAWRDHFIGRFKLVVFDEIQELRTGHSDEDSSRKNVAAAHVSWSADYRMGLTATPIYNYGGELWNIIDVLAPGALGTQEEFLREWCAGYDKRKARVMDPPSLGSYLRSTGLMLRRTRDDVGRQLPPVSKVVHEIAGDYDSAFWDSETSAAELAKLVLDTSAKNFDRMQASAHLDALLRQATGVSKAPHVAAFVRMLLEQETDKVLLFGWHREVYSIWGELLEDLGVAWYTGSESVSRKRKEVDRFVSGDAKIMVMSLRAGTGLNRLQEVCATAVFGELDWSPGVHEQCTGRLHRDGQKRPVFAYYPVATSGSDPVVCDVLGLKTSQVEGLRDPDGAALISRQIDPRHIQKLAEDYLRRIGGRK